MNVTCPECRSIFRVDPAKVPAGGVRARCSVCGGIFPVAPETRSRAAHAGADVERRRTPQMPVPAIPTPAASPPSLPAPAAAERPAPRHEPPANPLPEPPKDASIWGSPAAVPAQRFTAPAALEFGAPSTPATPTPPAMPAVAAAPPAPETPAPAPAAVPAPAEAPARRPVNPYLSNDPNQKARRLARALVSDLIAYHPQKREEGLRAGTLKQLFRDEIRKSWEEYVEQVGAPLAESTPHFQDALNDLLAGGRKVF